MISILIYDMNNYIILQYTVHIAYELVIRSNGYRCKQIANKRHNGRMHKVGGSLRDHGLLGKTALCDLLAEKKICLRKCEN